MRNNPLPRLDRDLDVRRQLLPHCRLKLGEIWVDPISGHRVGCLDATSKDSIQRIMGDEYAKLAIHDPPYNLTAFELREIGEFIDWCKKWISITYDVIASDTSLYIWLGADQRDGFQPLPDFIMMMREYPFCSKSLITMRNQRGYGTQKNWMAVRQELLYCIKGNPVFNVEAEYTDIPKIVRGYYKDINGRKKENIERSRSNTIRAGNVWVDIQQVFYRMEENVSGCYAQKPLKCIQRIISASSNKNDIVIDFFSHSGATLLASEILNRRCFTIDIDPVYAEITIRRLERFRIEGKFGWQNGHAFQNDLHTEYLENQKCSFKLYGTSKKGTEVSISATTK